LGFLGFLKPNSTALAVVLWPDAVPTIHAESYHVAMPRIRSPPKMATNSGQRRRAAAILGVPLFGRGVLPGAGPVLPLCSSLHAIVLSD